MTRPTPTTVLLIDTLLDAKCFTERAKLVRYAVPPQFHKSGFDRYAHLHNELRDKLEQPYYFYSYDKQGPAIYVLYEPDSQPVEIQLDFMNGVTLGYAVLPVHDVAEFHILVKVLLAAYFQSRRHNEVTSQGSYYVLAKEEYGGSELTCLKIEVKGNVQNREDAAVQAFTVTGSATRFRLWKRDMNIPFRSTKPFFGRLSPKQGQTFLRPIKRNEVSTTDLETFVHYTRKGEHATLPFHDTRKTPASRGYILHTFIKNFIPFLRLYGISARMNERDFSLYRPPAKHSSLSLDELETVYMLDNRLNRNTVPIETYTSLLNETYGEELGIRFEVIESEQVSEATPLLILIDAERADFLEGGRLTGRKDPYPDLYSNPRFLRVPRQSINVNPNKTVGNREAYLEYGLIPIDTPAWDLRIRVSLNELYLKDLMLRAKTVFGRLPFLNALDTDASLQQYAFVRKATVRGHTYRTLLYFEDGAMRFANLLSPVEGQQLYRLLEKYGLDWDEDVIEPFLAKYCREGKTEEDLTDYDFILGPGQVIEIEDTGEQVLYDYDTIEEREEDLVTPYSIEALKLAEHYDDLKRKAFPPLIELEQISSIPPGKRGEGVMKAQKFLEQLRQYDALLDEVARYRTSLTFEELTSGELMEQIAIIFPTMRRGDKFNRSYLKNHLYNRLGMFLAVKGQDVQMFQGIWYDDDRCYMVGSPQGIEWEQPTAHRLRRFDVYRSKDFNTEQWLDTVSVMFVRPKQYTVFPYFFHLLDLYVSTVLLHEDLGETEEEQP